MAISSSPPIEVRSKIALGVDSESFPNSRDHDRLSALAGVASYGTALKLFFCVMLAVAQVRILTQTRSVSLVWAVT